MELIEPGLPPAPIHHVGGPHLLHHRGEPFDDDELASLVEAVRSSVTRATSAALDELSNSVPEPIVSMSLRNWPSEFPEDISIQRQVPYESRADPIMYRQVLSELAHVRSWAVHLYDGKDVESLASQRLAERSHDVLHGPRAALGPPWSKDHRMALAAAVLAG